MIRTKGEAGAGDTVEAVRHVRMLHKEIKMVQNMSDDDFLPLCGEVNYSSGNGRSVEHL